jgi:hypothetical protein
MNRSIVLLPLAVASFLFATAALAQPPTFSVKAFPTLPGATSETVYGITDEGVAIGIIQGGSKCQTECVVAWYNGIVTVQDSPWGATGFPTLTVAKEQGILAGTAVVNSVNEAIVWYSDVPTVLPPPDSQHTATTVYGINDKGQVVGSASDSAGDAVAVVWNSQVPSILGSGPDSAYAMGANDSGLIVGYVCCSPTLQNEAVVWHGTKATVLPKSSPVQGAGGAALAVNSSGVVVGQASDTGVVAHAVAWSNQAIISLSDQASSAVAINYQGIIVGEVQSATGPHATVWGNFNATAQDLNSLISADAAAEIVLTSAVDINDNCVIVADGYVKSSAAKKAFVLTLNDHADCVNGMLSKESLR